MAALFPQGRTAATVLTERLPDLNEAPVGRRVPKPSKSGHNPFTGEVHEWPGFRQMVREFCNHHRPAPLEITRESVQSRMYHEDYLCGQESGIQGRFVQQVLHVMNCIGGASQTPLLWADLKAANLSREQMLYKEQSLPDFACLRAPVTSDGSMRIVGEIKADFNDHMLDHYNPRSDGTFDIRSLIRQWLSQPGQYMAQFQLKYAFITTYRHTLFLCLPTFVNPNMITEYDRLYISPPMPHYETPSRDTVTVRECFWWFMNEVIHNGFQPSPRSPGHGMIVNGIAGRGVFRGQPTQHILPPGPAPQNTSQGGPQPGLAPHAPSQMNLSSLQPMGSSLQGPGTTSPFQRSPMGRSPYQNSPMGTSPYQNPPMGLSPYQNSPMGPTKGSSVPIRPHTSAGYPTYDSRTPSPEQDLRDMHVTFATGRDRKTVLVTDDGSRRATVIYSKDIKCFKVDGKRRYEWNGYTLVYKGKRSHKDLEDYYIGR